MKTIRNTISNIISDTLDKVADPRYSASSAILIVVAVLAVTGTILSLTAVFVINPLIVGIVTFSEKYGAGWFAPDVLALIVAFPVILIISVAARRLLNPTKETN